MHWKLFRGRQLRYQREATQTVGEKKKEMMDKFTSVTLIVGDNFIRRPRTENEASRMKMKQQTNRLSSMFSFIDHRLIDGFEKQQNQLLIGKILIFIYF